MLLLHRVGGLHAGVSGVCVSVVTAEIAKLGKVDNGCTVEKSKVDNAHCTVEKSKVDNAHCTPPHGEKLGNAHHH